MSLALLPVGLIAVWQTQSVTEQSQKNAELALRVLTEQAAQEERLIIQRAFGAAQTLGSGVVDLIGDTEACTTALRSFVENSPYVFAGFVPVSGFMECSSAGQSYDFSEYDSLKAALANPGPRVEANPAGAVSGEPVIIISDPVYDVRDINGPLLGFMSVSLPVKNFQITPRETPNGALQELITFNDLGQIVTSMGGQSSAERSLPRGVTLQELAQRPPQAFSSPDRQGNRRVFTLATIENKHFYVLGVWNRDQDLAVDRLSGLTTSLFPAIMWMVSLGVALFAIHQLVTRHIRVLGRQMTAFASRRTLPAEPFATDTPTEIRRIQDVFLNMTDAILHDEAELENAVREKNVLLKEVHHRVKNNLQLISSMINMQVREVDSPEAKRALRRIQDRVLSLATIHRDLYQSTNAGLINVGALLEEIVSNTVEMAEVNRSDVELELDVDDIWLYPDQAVPMSLLAAEAVTNAMKYVGDPASGAAPWVKLRFKSMEGLSREFELLNSIGTSKPHDEFESTGMGSKLISAFATQLGARVKAEREGPLYRMNVIFEAQEFALEQNDF